MIISRLGILPYPLAAAAAPARSGALNTPRPGAGAGALVGSAAGREPPASPDRAR